MRARHSLLLLLSSLVLSSVLVPSRAQAEPTRLRIGTVAPAGSSWARAMKAFADELAAETHGALQLKWYLNAVTGDEFETIDRMARGQLDGAALSAGCEAVAPSLRVVRIPGLTRDRDENRMIIGRLGPRLEAELHARGLQPLAMGELGPIVLFSRRPIRRFDELQRTRLWTWDRDAVWPKLLAAMGLSTVSLPVNDAARAFDEGRIDGFWAAPTAALTFQWSTQARYFSDLPVGVLPGCLLLTQRTVDALPIEQQNALRKAAARFGERFLADAERMDAQLLGGLLERQGAHRVQVDESMRVNLFEAARQARDTPGAAPLVPPELVAQVLGWLADYRAMH